MNLDRLLLIAFAVFFVLFGIFRVTNISVIWGEPLIGFSALVAGIICTVRAFQ
jgi:hypothetical protein